MTQRAGVSGAGGLAYRPTVRGGRSEGRTPVISMEQGMNDQTTRATLQHELGHILEPYMVRTPERGAELMKLLGLNLPKDKRANAWSFPQDRWGLSGNTNYLDKGGVPVLGNPTEYYANIVSRQLGRPSYSDLTAQERASRGLALSDYSPNLPNPLIKQLVNHGFIPPRVPLTP